MARNCVERAWRSMTPHKLLTAVKRTIAHLWMVDLQGEDTSLRKKGNVSKQKYVLEFCFAKSLTVSIES